MRIGLPVPRLVLAALLVGTGVAPAALAQIQGMPGLDATKPLGEPQTPSGEPTGETVPVTFTAAQADRGHRAYTSNCVDCHGPQLNDGEFGGAPLVGSYFRDHWGGLTADALYGYVSSAMPPDRPGGLSPETYADIVAFLLERNGVAPGSQELPSDLDKLGTMEIPATP
jgi:mono/diheme cytochrome c family protein